MEVKIYINKNQSKNLQQQREIGPIIWSRMLENYQIRLQQTIHLPQLMPQKDLQNILAKQNIKQRPT